jgi:hypothetical protein
MNFNRVLVTFHNKHGIQNGITWITSDFQQKKELELKLHEFQ